VTRPRDADGDEIRGGTPCAHQARRSGWVAGRGCGLAKPFIRKDL
jgi:hypothetical protein